MAMTAPPHRMTAAEFFDDPTVPDLAELVDGEVVPLTTPPPVHGWLARNVQRALDAHAVAHRLGEVFGGNVPYQLDPHTVRVPDVSFIRAERMAGPPPGRGGWPFAPDLAVEILSPSETHRSIRRKLEDYFAAGTRLVWLVDPEERGVEVHAAGAPMRWVNEAGALDGADVLPGFVLAVRDVYAGIARPG